jgi:hypothetical protein
MTSSGFAYSDGIGGPREEVCLSQRSSPLVNGAQVRPPVVHNENLEASELPDMTVAE